MAAGAAEFVPVDAGVAAAAAEGGDDAAGAEFQRLTDQRPNLTNFRKSTGSAQRNQVSAITAARSFCIRSELKRPPLGGLFFCQRAQVSCAMPRLAAGEAVTTVAIDLGYENPAAFTLMFKRAFGSPPLTYLGIRSARMTA